MENNPSQNWKRNGIRYFDKFVDNFGIIKFNPTAQSAHPAHSALNLPI
jgi:hypothetical protein